MPCHMAPRILTREPFLQSPIVSVEFCDSITHDRKHIADIPFHIIARHAPKWFPMLIPNISSGTFTLPLLIPTLSHTSDIEIPALTLLFTSWLTSTPFRTHPRPSIADSALIYRALQLALYPSANGLQHEILKRLRAEPVDETDVQTLWWVFQYTDAFIEVLDALLFNIVRFSVLEAQPSDGLILHFIETELQQLHERAQERVLQMYGKHMQNFAARASLVQRRGKAWKGVFDGRKWHAPRLLA